MSVQTFILWTVLFSVISSNTLAAEIQVTLKAPASEKMGRAIYTITAGDIDGEASVVTVASPNNGKTMASAEIVGVKSTFSSTNAPYGGQITSTIQCHTQKYIKEQNINFNDEKTQVILAVASNRRIFGICTVNEIKFAVAVWSVYDKKRSRVLSVKLYKPISEATQIQKAQQDILQILNKVINQI